MADFEQFLSSDKLDESCTTEQARLVRAVWAVVRPYGLAPELSVCYVADSPEVTLDWSRGSLWASLTIRHDGTPKWVLRMPGLVKHRSPGKPWGEQDQQTLARDLPQVINCIKDTPP